jgi:hypothetical protein
MKNIFFISQFLLETISTFISTFRGMSSTHPSSRDVRSDIKLGFSPRSLFACRERENFCHIKFIFICDIPKKATLFCLNRSASHPALARKHTSSTTLLFFIPRYCIKQWHVEHSKAPHCHAKAKNGTLWISSSRRSRFDGRNIIKARASRIRSNFFSFILCCRTNVDFHLVLLSLLFHLQPSCTVDLV